MEELGSPEACLANGGDEEFCETVCEGVVEDGVAQGDSLELLKCLPDESVDLVVTSPPYADRRSSTYGGVKADDYVEWFLPYTDEMQRVLRPDGSFALNINDIAEEGERHPYVYELVLSMRDRGWLWIDTYMWKKTNPFPGRWKNRLKHGFEYIYHFTKTRDITWNADAVRQPAKQSTKDRLSRLRGDDFKRRESESGSGFAVRHANFEKETALPSNVLEMGTVSYNKGHSAAYPEALPEFFVKLLSEEGDLVLDPFMGSGTTAVVAKRNCRRFLGFDKEAEYVELARGNAEEEVLPEKCAL
jgi:site-specific DNA-methyltransferase (adenine-specific)